MIRKAITYPDLDGNPITEDFYFNLSMNETIAMGLNEGLVTKLFTLGSTAAGYQVVEMFTGIIRSAVGKRSEDGKRLEKDPVFADEFINSAAFDTLLWELIGNEQYAGEFVTGIFPANMNEKMKELTQNQSSTVQLPGEPAKRPEDYSEQELLDLSTEDWYKLVGRDPKSWSQPILLVAIKRQPGGKE